MAVWSVKPDWKKSIIERQIWTKEGVAGYISHEIGWRWGEFTVTTDDDNPPELEEGVDIYSCGYDAELVELTDGCWDESDVDVQDEELRIELETFLEENSVFDLEELGWDLDDTEMIINCEMTIELIEKTDGTKPEEDVESGDSIACFSCDKTVAANDLIEMDGQMHCPYCHEGWVEPDNRPEDKKWPFA